jgi:hypothetical protein
MVCEKSAWTMLYKGSPEGFRLARPAESDPCSVAWVVPLLPAPAR